METSKTKAAANGAEKEITQKAAEGAAKEQAKEQTSPQAATTTVTDEKTSKEAVTGTAVGEKTETTVKARATTKPVPEYLKPYVKAYPREKVFLVTSDKQVFLRSAANMAALHQKSLSDNGKVETVTV